MSIEKAGRVTAPERVAEEVVSSFTAWAEYDRVFRSASVLALALCNCGRSGEPMPLSVHTSTCLYRKEVEQYLKEVRLGREDG